jgi:hypothetical protein
VAIKADTAVAPTPFPLASSANCLFQASKPAAVLPHCAAPALAARQSNQGTDRAAYPMKPIWYDPNADNPPWIKALADVRHMGTRESYCFHHVQAIMLAIDQYAETALGNRQYFLNKPHSIGGKSDNIP